MRNEKQVGKMVEKFAKAAGGIDILVNNAGSLIERQSFEKGTVAYHNDVYDTNVLSIFLATRAALPYLKKSKGNIVNIGSIAGHTGGCIGFGDVRRRKGGGRDGNNGDGEGIRALRHHG